MTAQDPTGATRITRPLSDRDGLSGDEIGGPRSAATGATEREPEYLPPEYDPADYDTVEAVAEIVAPLFAAHGWTYGNGVVSAAELAATIGRLYENHRLTPLEYSGSGRLMLRDENPHNGHPVLYDGIQVYVHVGELPPLRGDEVLDAD